MPISTSARRTRRSSPTSTRWLSPRRAGTPTNGSSARERSLTLATRKDREPAPRQRTHYDYAADLQQLSTAGLVAIERKPPQTNYAGKVLHLKRADESVPVPQSGSSS